MKIYEYDEWDVIQHESYDPDKRTYVDSDDHLVTGILKNFHYFKEGDPRNDQYVENGVPQ